MSTRATNPDGAVVPEPTSFWASLFGRKKIAAKKLNANVTFVSDVGCVRTNNEDFYGYLNPDPPTLVAVVADGMGGHACGEVASQMAVELLIENFKKHRKNPSVDLAKALQAANAGIFKVSRKDASKRNMGTTCTAVALVGRLLHLAHVGDSRLYLVRGGKAYQLSQDHTQVHEWVVQGILDPEEAKRHPDRNVLSRAVGTKPHVEVEHWPEPMQMKPGDALLLCSDGLHDLVTDDEIGRIVTDSRSTSPDNLIALAKSRGAPDNVTAGVIQILADDMVETREVPI